MMGDFLVVRESWELSDGSEIETSEGRELWGKGVLFIYLDEVMIAPYCMYRGSCSAPSGSNQQSRDPKLPPSQTIRTPQWA
jgi:hypothetical protein